MVIVVKVSLAWSGQVGHGHSRTRSGKPFVGHGRALCGALERHVRSSNMYFWRYSNHIFRLDRNLEKYWSKIENIWSLVPPKKSVLSGVRDETSPFLSEILNILVVCYFRFPSVEQIHFQSVWEVDNISWNSALRVRSIKIDGKLFSHKMIIMLWSCIKA